MHLEDVFPSPSLFPSGNASYALALATHKVISNVVQAAQELVIPNVAPILDERGREYFNETRIRQAASRGATQKEEGQILERKNAVLKELSVIIGMLEGKRDKSGPFFEGKKISYADFCIVCYLAWFQRVERDTGFSGRRGGSGFMGCMFAFSRGARRGEDMG